MTDQSPPDVLYHYTTQEALLKIFEGERLEQERKHVLWATKIQYMNDASELVAPLRTADGILKQKESKGSIADKTQRDMVRAMRWAIRDSANVNIGVIAFSIHKDRLSQWRAYSQDGPGYAIGLDPAKLVPRTLMNKLRLAPCEYLKRKEQRGRIADLISEYISPAPNASSLPIKTHFVYRLITMASTMKDRSFREEGEWRIVPSDICHATDLIDYTYWTCHFRAGKSMIIPYWHLPLDLSAIKEIWIGPTPHPKLAKEALKGLLYNHDLGEQAQVENSRIPYRNW